MKKIMLFALGALLCVGTSAAQDVDAKKQLLDLDKQLEKVKKGDKAAEAYIHYQRAAILINLEDEQNAMNALGKAVELQPENLDYRYIRASLASNIGNNKIARDDYSKIVELDPNDPNALLGLGCALGALNDNDKALECFNKAVELAPEEAKVYPYRATQLINMKRYDEAGADVIQTLRLDPENARAAQLVNFLGAVNYNSFFETVMNLKITDPDLSDTWSNLMEQIENAYRNAPSTEITERDATDADELVMAEFPGGRSALREYVAAQVTYPKKLAKSRMPGKVKVEVLINEEGYIADARIAESLSEEQDAEALRICTELPQFTPARMKGEPVEIWYPITVNFEK